MSLHRNLGFADAHVAYSLEYADAAARLAAVLTPADVGRIARQADAGTFWILADDSPLTWLEVGAAPFDIRDMLLFDHFLASTNLTQRAGIPGWAVQVSGTGSDITFVGETGHPGIADGGPGVTAAGRAGMWIGDTAFTLMTLGSVQGKADMEWLIRVNTHALSAVSNKRFTVGWGDAWDGAAGVEHNNGIYLELNPALSANFQLVTKAAGVATRVNSTIAAAAATWYRIGLRVSYPLSVPTAQLFINGVLRATTTATFPVAGMGIGIRMDANATVDEPRWQADYMTLSQVTSKET